MLIPLFISTDDFNDIDKNVFNLEQEVLNGIVGLVDVVGLYIILSQKRLIISPNQNVKILAIAIGWTAAELLTTNLLSIIM